MFTAICFDEKEKRKKKKKSYAGARKKMLKGFKFRTFNGRFQVTSWQ